MARISRANFLRVCLISSLVLLGSFCNSGQASLSNNLLNDPLFDSDYKIAAHYVPALALRALAHAEVYQKKRKAYLERTFTLQGNVYETWKIHIQVEGDGLFKRKVSAKGFIGNLPLSYENEIACSLPKNANMKVSAKLDGQPILNLTINSDGNKMTNYIGGNFLGRAVAYKTSWRDTIGTLAGFAYNMHVEGVKNEANDFKVVSKGNIGASEIKGEGILIKKDHYEFTEHYGPILIKSKLIVI